MAARGGTFRARWWQPPPVQESTLGTLSLVMPVYDRSASLSASGAIWAVARKDYGATASLVGRGGHRNIVPSPDMTGAVTGRLGAGGALPAGWGYTPTGMNAEFHVEGFGTLQDGQSYIDIRIAGTNNTGGTATPSVNFVGTNSPEKWASAGDSYSFNVATQLLLGSLPANTHACVLSERGSNDSQTAGTVSVSNPTALLINNGAFRTLTHAATRSIWAMSRLAFTAGMSLDVTIRYATPHVQRNRSMGTLLGSLGNQDILVRGSDVYRIRDGSVVLAASSAVAAAAEISSGTIYNAAGSVAGTGILAGFGYGDRPGSAMLAARAMLGAHGERIADRTVALSASGSVIAGARRDAQVAAHLQPSGLLAAIPHAERVGSATLTGAGSSLAFGGGLRLRSVCLMALSSLAGTAAVVRAGEASLAASRTMVASRGRERHRPVLLLAAGELSAAAMPTRDASAWFAGGGVLYGLVAVNSIKSAGAGLSASSCLAGDAIRVANATADLLASSTCFADAIIDGPAASECSASASLTAIALVTSEALRERTRKVALASIAELLTTGTEADKTGSAQLAASGAVHASARPRRRAFASNALNLGI